MQYKLSVQDYVKGLRENKLLGLKCQDCGTITCPPRMVCRKCAGPNLEVTTLSGRGKIVTLTSVYVPPESRIGKTPYIIVMVELEEGPWIMGNLCDTNPATASAELIDRPVLMVPNPLDPTEKPDTGGAPLFKLA
jgi:uncharacterized OB-fold protein